MDQKTWSWRKRSVHKSVDSDAGISIKGNEEERLDQYDKEAALERTVKNLHEKIASLLCECNSKDTLIAEHAKTAQEAISGREKVLEELALKNQELESTIKQKLEANERIVHLNTALKDYREQLNSIKEDKRASEPMEELKRANKRLEEKVNESNQTLADLTVENARLSNTLMIKDELIEDISHQMSQATIGFNELISRLDSIEKENAILKYEYRVLERELEVQTRCADVASGQQRESMKRAAKMESECQKLRLLVKKQMTGLTGSTGSGLEGLDKRMAVLINRLYEVEEENKILKEFIRQKDDEISILQIQSQSQSQSQSQRLMIGDIDMSLMDDFVEMERLAIVTSDASNLDSIGKELVTCDASNLVQVAQCDWLTSIVSAITEQIRVSERSVDEVLKEVRQSLQCDGDSVGGYITWKSPEPESGIPGVEAELERVKEQLENQKMVNEDLDHQISVAKYEINEANQKISGLKVELEDRCHCCEELEATCLELQLQLASLSDKDAENVDVKKEGWEITAASAKLAECQETIFSIGRQIKALAPPPTGVAAELTNDQKSRRHSCLRDHMVVEEGGGDVADPVKTKEMVSVTERKVGPVVRVGSCKTRVVPGALAIVTSKKRGKGSEMWRKLLFRKKKVLTIGV